MRQHSAHSSLEGGRERSEGSLNHWLLSHSSGEQYCTHEQ